MKRQTGQPAEGRGALEDLKCEVSQLSGHYSCGEGKIIKCFNSFWLMMKSHSLLSEDLSFFVGRFCELIRFLPVTTSAEIANKICQRLRSTNAQRDDCTVALLPLLAVVSSVVSVEERMTLIQAVCDAASDPGTFPAVANCLSEMASNGAQCILVLHKISEYFGWSSKRSELSASVQCSDWAVSPEDLPVLFYHICNVGTVAESMMASNGPSEDLESGFYGLGVLSAEDSATDKAPVSALSGTEIQTIHRNRAVCICFCIDRLLADAGFGGNTVIDAPMHTTVINTLTTLCHHVTLLVRRSRGFVDAIVALIKSRSTVCGVTAAGMAVTASLAAPCGASAIEPLGIHQAPHGATPSRISVTYVWLCLLVIEIDQSPMTKRNDTVLMELQRWCYEYDFLGAHPAGRPGAAQVTGGTKSWLPAHAWKAVSLTTATGFSISSPGEESPLQTALFSLLRCKPLLVAGEQQLVSSLLSLALGMLDGLVNAWVCGTVGKDGVVSGSSSSVPADRWPGALGNQPHGCGAIIHRVAGVEIIAELFHSCEHARCKIMRDVVLSALIAETAQGSSSAAVSPMQSRTMAAARSYGLVVTRIALFHALIRRCPYAMAMHVKNELLEVPSALLRLPFGLSRMLLEVLYVAFPVCPGLEDRVQMVLQKGVFSQDSYCRQSALAALLGLLQCQSTNSTSASMQHGSQGVVPRNSLIPHSHGLFAMLKRFFRCDCRVKSTLYTLLAQTVRRSRSMALSLSLLNCVTEHLTMLTRSGYTERNHINSHTNSCGSRFKVVVLNVPQQESASAPDDDVATAATTAQDSQRLHIAIDVVSMEKCLASGSTLTHMEAMQGGGGNSNKAGGMACRIFERIGETMLQLLALGCETNILQSSLTVDGRHAKPSSGAADEAITSDIGVELPPLPPLSQSSVVSEPSRQSPLPATTAVDGRIGGLNSTTMANTSKSGAELDATRSPVVPTAVVEMWCILRTTALGMALGEFDELGVAYPALEVMCRGNTEERVVESPALLLTPPQACRILALREACYASIITLAALPLEGHWWLGTEGSGDCLTVSMGERVGAQGNESSGIGATETSNACAAAATADPLSALRACDSNTVKSTELSLRRHVIVLLFGRMELLHRCIVRTQLQLNRLHMAAISAARQSALSPHKKFKKISNPSETIGISMVDENVALSCSNSAGDLETSGALNATPAAVTAVPSGVCAPSPSSTASAAPMTAERRFSDSCTNSRSGTP